MNGSALTKTALALALFTLMATEAQAIAPRDVDDLVGARANNGESELQHRGYHHRKTINVSGNPISYWWNPRQQACIAVTTADGRYKSIMAQPEAVCEPTEYRGSDRHHSDERHGEEAPPGGFGNRTPQITTVDNGNVAVDLGGCNVLFNRHGGIVDKGASCAEGDVREARDAFNAHRREQGAPAAAEAPPGGYGGQSAAASVTCESKDNRYQYCRQSIGSNAQVRIKRRLSSSSCREGESWGYDADGVWVDKGCRAVFEVR